MSRAKTSTATVPTDAPTPAGLNALIALAEHWSGAGHLVTQIHVADPAPGVETWLYDGGANRQHASVIVPGAEFEHIVLSDGERIPLVAPQPTVTPDAV